MLRLWMVFQILSYNRTILELKLKGTSTAFFRIRSYNRTILELKLRTIPRGNLGLYAL